MMLKEANDILFAARQAGIDVLLKDGKLQLRVSRGSTPNPALAEEIKKNKDSIMQLLGDGKWKAERVDKAASSILPGDRSKGYIPLSYEQERLWMVDRKEGSVAYHSSVVMRVGDGEDVELLERSIRGVIDRHEVLRTVIREEEGRGYQEVLERGSWRMSRSEWGGYRALSGEVRGYVEQLISRPFDLSADHPLRAELVRTGEGDVLVVVLHHIASDAWSMGVLV
ncbi:MAG: hypothetical protein J0H74_36680, partial [Chitinophagaceae bacterium]|nr:hypothetical protein [Chitinophagaceae bacterium]